jgi:hypothetical protein
MISEPRPRAKAFHLYPNCYLCLQGYLRVWIELLLACGAVSSHLRTQGGSAAHHSMALSQKRRESVSPHYRNALSRLGICRMTRHHLCKATKCPASPALHSAPVASRLGYPLSEEQDGWQNLPSYLPIRQLSLHPYSRRTEKSQRPPWPSDKLIALEIVGCQVSP